MKISLLLWIVAIVSILGFASSRCARPKARRRSRRASGGSLARQASPASARAVPAPFWTHSHGWAVSASASSGATLCAAPEVERLLHESRQHFGPDAVGQISMEAGDDAYAFAYLCLARWPEVEHVLLDRNWDESNIASYQIECALLVSAGDPDEFRSLLR